MENLKISVIIPVYNSEKYIAKCLDSILCQTYKNFEVICVNDGSFDSSLSILENYKDKDGRIKIISQNNGGPSKARNTGVNNAKGKYIAFIDADDYIDRDYLNNLIYDLKDVDMSVCNYVELNNTGKHNVEIFKFLKYGTTENNLNIINEVISGPGGLVWGKLFSKDIIDKNNIIFNEEFKMCEDLLFVTEFIVKATRIKKINKSLYIHNKCNENSITANYNSEMFFYQLKIQKQIKSILSSTKYKNRDIESVLSMRIKDILIYSIYKEVKSKRGFNLKISNIKRYILSNEIVKEKIKFECKGPIDRMLVEAINKERVLTIYILTILREFILNIYNRLVWLKGENTNAESKYSGSNI